MIVYLKKKKHWHIGFIRPEVFHYVSIFKMYSFKCVAILFALEKMEVISLIRCLFSDGGIPWMLFGQKFQNLDPVEFLVIYNPQAVY